MNRILKAAVNNLNYEELKELQKYVCDKINDKENTEVLNNKNNCLKDHAFNCPLCGATSSIIPKISNIYNDYTNCNTISKTYVCKSCGNSIILL